eukprot:jgi/Chrzof1/9150/Cz03g37220.t1
MALTRISKSACGGYRLLIVALVLTSWSGSTGVWAQIDHVTAVPSQSQFKPLESIASSFTSGLDSQAHQQVGPSRQLQGIQGPFAIQPTIQPLTAVSSQLTVDIDASARGLMIPDSFLGVSHEWLAVEELVNRREYLQVLKDLSNYGAGPQILRIGGGSTDLQRFVPNATVWKALTTLHKEAGIKFILGINFEAGDIILSKKQMMAAQQSLPAGSIVAFELGNEPNFYLHKGGKSPSEYVSCCFVREWQQFAQNMSCPKGPESCTYSMFAGPAWGHIHMWERTMQWYLK